MRTIYTKILAWGLATLFVSMAVFAFISIALSRRSAVEHGRFGSMPAYQLEEVAANYERGGAREAAKSLDRINRYFPGEHYFTDASGRDLVTGDDRSAVIAESLPPSGMPFGIGRDAIWSAISADGKYRFLIHMKSPPDLWGFVPYYSPILLLVALICWLLAISLASPIGKLAKAVENFGRGDLSVRMNSRRRDEIGGLARAFDVMADRIQTLLTAERRLLQDVSHELRSPLARLSFATELARTASDRDAAAARLHKEIARLDRLVESLLQVTRLEGDPQADQREVMEFGALVKEVVDDCELEAGARGIRIEFHAEAEASVCGDRELLRRAVENVTGNAVRYGRPDTAVEVSLRVVENRAVLTVKDYGDGVPEELLAKIFSPFFRVDDSRASATGGVGLGLAIAQRAVHLHHGSITARNAGPGLAVEICVPLCLG